MRGGRKGLAPPLRWRGSLLANRSIVLIVADHYPWFIRAFTDKLLLLLQILRILAVHSGSFSICFSESLGKKGGSSQINLPRCGDLSPYPSPSDVSNLVVSMGGQVNIFHWSGSVWRYQFAAACKGGSCSRDCHGYLPALTWSARDLLPTLKAPVPNLIYWRWV